MRDASTALIEAQKDIPATPCFKVEVQGFGYPAKDNGLRVNMFDWMKMYSSEDTQVPHSMAFAGDGSLIRAKVDSVYDVYVQRIEDPDSESNYDTWTKLADAHNSGNYKPIAVIALGSKVVVFCMGENAGNAGGTHYIVQYVSNDYGVTFGSPAATPAYYTSGVMIAACFKSDGTYALIDKYGDEVGIYLYDSGWSSGGTVHIVNPIDSLSLAYDEDWYVIVTCNSANRVYRVIYGDGGLVTAGVWYDTDNATAVIVSNTDVEDIDDVELRPYSFSTKIANTEIEETRWQSHFLGGGISSPVWKEKLNFYTVSRNFLNIFKKAGFSATIANAEIGLIKIPGVELIMSVFLPSDDVWFFKLRPDGDFKDNCVFEKTELLTQIATFGTDLTYDSNTQTLWAGGNDFLYKCNAPTSWSAPSAGSGAGDSNTLTDLSSHFIVKCKNIHENPSDLEIIFDNSSGQFANPGTGDLDQLKKGSIIKLDFGYEIEGTPTYPTSKNYARMAVRNWEHWSNPESYPGFVFFSLYGEDGASLLSRKKLPKPMEWNKYSDTKCIYDIVGDLIATIGGTLSYVSRSTAITSIYPKLKVGSGETILSIINQLMGEVDDVIRWYGIDAEIIYPQTSDSSVYRYNKSLL